MAHYTQTYSSPAQLVTLLQSRGLHVENVARTENYLRHIDINAMGFPRGWESEPLWQ